MRHLLPVSIVSGVALAMVLVACGSSEDAAHDGGAAGPYQSAGGAGAGGDSGTTVTVGEGGARAGAYELSAHCGSDGCIPATGEQNLEPCMLDGEGGGVPGEGDCALAITNPADGTLEGVCVEAGGGDAGAPCLTAANCGAGMGCVGTPGTCRAYCCGDVEACDPGTYCALRDLASQEVANVTDPPQIPVCELADHCTLFETCQDPEKTCTVVRQDGTTSCVPKGNGGGGEACPCKAGFMCNTALNECQQLCSVNGVECPMGSYCQSSTNLPQDFGICDSY